MKFPAFLASALALTAAYGQIGVSTAIARTAKANHGQQAAAVDVDTNVVFDKTDGVLKYRSPFDAETSIKLSAIVTRPRIALIASMTKSVRSARLFKRALWPRHRAKTG